MLTRACVKRLGLSLFLIAVGIAGLAWLRPPDPPGVRAPLEPVQVMVEPSTAPYFQAGEWQLQPLATYDITARLIHKKRYYGGPTADLAPYDFAVGWGPMSDSSILRQLSISQGNRFFFWEYSGAPPIPEDQIICHAANMHLIPASSAVRRALWWASPGSVVRMTGYLVEATRPGMHPWRSSLSRTDTGNGACELMWVESCEFPPPPAPPRG